VGSVCLLAHLLDLRDRLAAEEVLAVLKSGRMRAPRSLNAVESEPGAKRSRNVPSFEERTSVHSPKGTITPATGRPPSEGCGFIGVATSS
jgi:hypothetical protein